MLFKLIKCIRYRYFKEAEIIIDRGTDKQFKRYSDYNAKTTYKENYIIYKRKNLITKKISYRKDTF